MDQPKIERLLRLMRLMSGSVNFSVDELAEKMDTSYRTIYRYIDTFKNAGFVVERQYGNVYRILKMPKSSKDLDKLVYFSEEEARVVAGLIQGLSGSNGMKANLYNKLSAIYDITSIGQYTDNKEVAFNIQMLEEAIQNGKQVRLKDYASSSSGLHDAVVEPYGFTGEYMDVWVYDVEKKDNRMYKIQRIGAVEILPDDWQFTDEHKKPYLDVFRMNGPTLTPVKLQLNTRAKNLLVEEFPLAEFDLHQDGDNWILETQVTHMEGVGRFVLGLAADVKIIDSPELTEFVRDYAMKYVDRL